MPTPARPRRPYRLGAAILLGPVLLVAAVLTSCGDDGSSDQAGDGEATSSTGTLATTSWVLAGWSEDGGDLQDPVDGAEAVLDFAAGGRLSGSGGCNRFFGAWEQDGSALSLTVGGTTEMACDEAATAQETAVLAAFGRVAGLRMDGDRLLLLDDGGATLLEYRAGVEDLVGTSWTATGVNNGREALVSTPTIDLATITFGADGTISGTGGCNTFSGPVTLTPPDGIDVADELRTTLRACADTAVDEQEQQFVAALQRATTYEISGSTLTLRDDQGAMQATFRLGIDGATDPSGDDGASDDGSGSGTVDPDSPVSSDAGG